jgi:heat shock protein HslJ
MRLLSLQLTPIGRVVDVSRVSAAPRAAVLAVLITSGFLAVSCSEATPTPSPTRTSSQGSPSPSHHGSITPRPVAAGWLLQEGLLHGNEIPLLDDYPIILVVTESELRGMSACNQYWSEMQRDDGEIHLSNIRATAVDCGGAIQDSDDAFLSALPKIARIDDSHPDILILEGRELLLRFVPSPGPPALPTSTWQLLRILDSNTQVDAGPLNAPSIAFNSAVSFSGWTGCRRLVGEYTFRGHQVLVTRMEAIGSCPASLERQDSKIIAVLGDGFYVGLRESELWISDSSTALVFAELRP